MYEDAPKNTVHQGKGTHKRDKRESQITQADTLNKRTDYTRGRGKTSILMTHNSLKSIMVTDATFQSLRGWLKAEFI